MSDQRNAEGYIAALIEELRGYEAAGKTDRAEQVRAELNRLGARAATPAKRAQRRVSKAQESR